MRKTVALSAVALMSTTAIATGAAVAPASAAPSKYKPDMPVSKQQYQKYNLKGRDIVQIRKAKKWAKRDKVRQVRQCESGGNYKINTGNGYYGAYQFAAGTWRGIGGGRYASYAHQAPKFAQDHMAWRLWNSQGWGPWGCA